MIWSAPCALEKRTRSNLRKALGPKKLFKIRNKATASYRYKSDLASLNYFLLKDVLSISDKIGHKDQHFYLESPSPCVFSRIFLRF